MNIVPTGFVFYGFHIIPWYLVEPNANYSIIDDLIFIEIYKFKLTPDQSRQLEIIKPLKLINVEIFDKRVLEGFLCKIFINSNFNDLIKQGYPN